MKLGLQDVDWSYIGARLAHELGVCNRPGGL